MSATIATLFQNGFIPSFPDFWWGPGRVTGYRLSETGSFESFESALFDEVHLRVWRQAAERDNGSGKGLVD